MNVSCTVSSLTECSKCPPAAATYDRSLLQNDTFAVSMNFCGKSAYPTLPARHDTSLLNGFIDPMANHLQCVQAPGFARITRSYRFSPKSLLVKPVNMHFVLVTQITHCEDITKYYSKKT